MNLNAPEIQALCARFHIRAKVLGLKAKTAASSLDTARLNGMASALQWAAQEVSSLASRTTASDPRTERRSASATGAVGPGSTQSTDTQEGRP